MSDRAQHEPAIRVIVAERLEVVHPRKSRGPIAHAREIEGFLDPPHKRFGKRAAPAGDLIHVAPRHGTMTGMEAVRHRVDGENVNVGREFVIDGPPQRLGRERLSQIEMRDLPERMHAGIGAARSHELERLVARRFGASRS